MKRILTAVCLVCVCAACADAVKTVTDGAKKRRDPERSRRLRAERTAALGGLVERPYEGRVFRVVNAQTRAAETLVAAVTEDVRRSVPVRMEMVTGRTGATAAELVAEAFAKPDTGAVAVLVTDPKSPVLLTAPEDGWCVLNVGKLAEDLPPEDVFETRVRKEIWRAVAFALNAAQSNMQPCLMADIKNVTDLDNARIQSLSPEAAMKCFNGARSRQINPVRRANYKRACEEGWAPAPTNDVQRAVWEKVKGGK